MHQLKRMIQLIAGVVSASNGAIEMFKTIAATLIMSAAMALPVHSSELDGAQIKQTISGRKVVLSTMGFSFPLFYAANGQVTGDGTDVGLARYFTPKETGRWWVENNKLCQQFPTWYKGKTWCFDLKKVDERRLNWTRDDGFSGKARISS
jgi:hypothetical protein